VKETDTAGLVIELEGEPGGLVVGDVVEPVEVELLGNFGHEYIVPKGCGVVGVGCGRGRVTSFGV